MDWAIYHAAYNDAAQRRWDRGEVGDHIGNKFEAYEFLQRVSPYRPDFSGDGYSTYVHPAQRARERVEARFAKLATRR